MTRIAPLIAIVLALAACPAQTSSSSSSTAADLVLKAYDVPSDQAAELEGIIDGLLYVAKDAPRRGSAALTPSGQLLVAAPAAFHPGIADVIAKLKSAPAQAAPTVRVDYWIVTGEPAAQPTSGGDVAREIAPVLDALQKNQGPLRLAMLERLSLSSQSGSHGGAEGLLFRVSQEAAVHGDKVVAKVEVRGVRVQGSLDARVEIPLGQVVVLGQAGTDALGGSKDARTTAFYVVRASVDGK